MKLIHEITHWYDYVENKIVEVEVIKNEYAIFVSILSSENVHVIASPMTIELFYKEFGRKGFVILEDEEENEK